MFQCRPYSVRLVRPVRTFPTNSHHSTSNLDASSPRTRLALTMKPSASSIFFSVATLAFSQIFAQAATLLPVEENGRCGYVDKSGNRVINPQFERAEPFSSGFAAVRLGKWGYIDNSGKFAINPQFDRATSFSEGLAAVEIANR